LIGLFDHTLSAASPLDNSSILSIHEYSAAKLRILLGAAHESGADQYQSYLVRRRSGGPRELFISREHAHEWLRLAACVKYVDGSWVAGVLSEATTTDRKSAKIAWQVISEEFGDGDLEKNHVHIYHHLIDALGLGGRDSNGRALRGHERGFDGLPIDQGVARCWSAAVAQQCIGLLAPEFFPESLGFNMAYETLPYHLLVTSHELRELKINDSYFALHITIDNPHTGHAAMAALAVETYLGRLSGEDQKLAWRRVQAGMVLAEGLPTTPWSPVEFEKADGQCRPKAGTPVPNPAERAVASLFVEKSRASRRMHCPSRARIQGQTLESWLDPSSMTLAKSLNFTRALATYRPFVVAGDVDSSRLIKEMIWGGRMFGAFSRSEVMIVEKWIIGLGGRSVRDGAYSSFAERLPHQTSPRMRTTPFASPLDAVRSGTGPLANCQTLDDLPTPVWGSCTENLMFTWFASLVLLDHFPLSPARLATPLGMYIIRVIRTQLGFPALHRQSDICAGLDHFGDGGDTVGLWEMGERIFGRTFNVNEIIDLMPPRWKELCAIRSRPYTNQAVLCGLSWAFFGLHDSPLITASIGQQDRRMLDRIELEQREAIAECVEHFRAEAGWWPDFVRGYTLGLGIVEL
jgi:hypothetical protein